MTLQFFERPILNSPYAYPAQHWELDPDGQVPYLMGSTRRKYLPDFIVQIDDGRGGPLNLVVEIKGFRGEDAKEKANTMQVYW